MKACPEQHRLYSTKYLLKYLWKKACTGWLSKYMSKQLAFLEIPELYKKGVLHALTNKSLVCTDAIWPDCIFYSDNASIKKTFKKGRIHVIFFITVAKGLGLNPRYSTTDHWIQESKHSHYLNFILILSRLFRHSLLSR